MNNKNRFYLNTIICNYCRQIQHCKISFTQRAFTLIELMVTLAIIGVIATIAAPAYENYMDKVTMLQATTDI